MRPRSIGIVCHDFPLGGTERIALRLAGAWARAGIAVTIFCGKAHGALLGLVPAEATLIEAQPPIPRAKTSRDRLGAAAARHFGTHPVDAVFVIGNYHWDIVPALAAIRPPARPRLLVQISSPLRMPQRAGFLQWLFERRMRRTLAGADACIAMDAAGAREAGRILRRPIVTACPLPAIDDDTPPPVAPPDAPRLLAAGRLIRQKGFDLLIAALARIDRATLTIVGDGPEREALERQAAALGLGDRVVFAGYVPDIRPLLDAARALVLPSRFEGYGAVIVEALAAGRPVIATRTTPAVADLLTDPARGLVVPPCDVAALADAITRLLAAPAPDPAMLAAAAAPFRLSAGAAAYLDALR